MICRQEGVICTQEGVIYGTHDIPSSRAPVRAKNENHDDIAIAISTEGEVKL